MPESTTDVMTTLLSIQGEEVIDLKKGRFLETACKIHVEMSGPQALPNGSTLHDVMNDDIETISRFVR